MNQINDNCQKHGLWEEYYKDGQLACKCNYLNGKFNGPFEHYFSNGNLSYKGIYLNGQEVGFWVDGNWNGKIRKEFYL